MVSTETSECLVGHAMLCSWVEEHACDIGLQACRCMFWKSCCSSNSAKMLLSQLIAVAVCDTKRLMFLYLAQQASLKAASNTQAKAGGLRNLQADSG